MNKDTLNIFLNKYRTVNSAKKRIEWCKTRPKHQDDIPYLEAVYEERLKEENENAARKKEKEEETKRKSEFEESLKPENFQHTYDVNIFPNIINVYDKYLVEMASAIKYLKEHVENDPEFKNGIRMEMSIIDNDGNAVSKQDFEIDYKEATISGFFAQQRIAKIIQKYVDELISEPNGKNTFPDWKVKHDGWFFYIECKTTHKKERCQVGINKKVVCEEMIEKLDIKSMLIPIFNIEKEIRELVDKNGVKYKALFFTGIRVWPAAMMVNYTNLNCYKNPEKNKKINISSKNTI